MFPKCELDRRPKLVEWWVLFLGIRLGQSSISRTSWYMYMLFLPLGRGGLMRSIGYERFVNTICGIKCNSEYLMNVDGYSSGIQSKAIQKITEKFRKSCEFKRLTGNIIPFRT